MTALAEVLEKLERATPGEWSVRNGREIGNRRLRVTAGAIGIGTINSSIYDIANAEAIAAAVNWLRENGPALLRDAGDGWRSIESAPRDGTRVLLCHSGYAHPFYDRDRMPRVWVDFFRGGSWYNTAPSGQPTHWRPLPQPPAMHAPGGAGGGE